VVPITHRTTSREEAAIEIPGPVRAHLGLDNRSSSVVLDELNEFVWPGRDIYPVPGGRPDQYDYGLVPPKLFDQVRDAVIALDDKKKSVMLRRD
jgi:hypothetical protein